MKKRRQTKTVFTCLLSLFLLLPFLLSYTPLQSGSQPLHPEYLTILYLNDLHGQLEPFRAEGGQMVGGAARVATLVKRIREENRQLGRHTLFLVAGDLFLGSSLSAFFKGEAELKFLNQVHPDAMTLGNHEFDFGMGILQERVQEASFPVISANTYKGKERLSPKRDGLTYLS